MKTKHLILLIGILAAACSLYADAPKTQVVKGIIKDAQSEFELIGATISLVNSQSTLGAITDTKGRFRIESVPIGRQTFIVSYLGYKSQTLPNVLVTTGKEVFLEIKLEESVEKLDEIVISSGADKDLPINELAKVSARTFSVEEVVRYSGGRNDVARIASSFAGVSAPNDSRNDIVVRGNSPAGLLWKIDGLPIATTNHYNTLGTTGGPVSALNTNMLRTSDFMTGAFPAEYGNANAAVFDVNFRNGNTDRHEFMAQLSAFTGMEAMVEGPISKKNNSSYLMAYRYGLASVAATGTSAIPVYQDLAFKLNLGDSKIGQFEVFGLGGKSSIDFYGDEIDEDDLFANPNENAFVNGELGLVGMSHLLKLNKSTYLKTTLGASTTYNRFYLENIDSLTNPVRDTTYFATLDENRETRYTINSYINKKFDAQWSLRAGTLVEIYDVTLFGENRDNNSNIPDDNGDGIPDFLEEYRNVKEVYYLPQFYAQAQYNVNNDLSTTFGIHAQYHTITEVIAIEPRLGMSWEFVPSQKLSLAYGLHAQAIQSPILFYRELDDQGNYLETNNSLDFTKAHHVVLGYDRRLGSDWRLKAEAYYQHLFDVPVEKTASSYSAINQGADFGLDSRINLVNEGTGRNYGVELTIEKFFSGGYYLLATTSLYDSKYKGSDEVLRNTAFNNQYVFNALFGKEWKFGKDKRHAWTFDTKFTTSGGNPYTPIDLAATREANGDVMYFEDLAFSERIAPYMRLDVKFGVRLNSAKRRLSQTFYLDFQNVTGRENEFVKRYNEVTDEINTVTQIGFFPDFMWRINF
ncbi:TonB-dependent receptor [Reichenbachiella versicolor]|uniref:TonB-dependent receptor n=1 Tax=Reichenbachiella versicolor TaxID=1821036 RepID=UPI000D6E3875|nr:TonB-dependent receptor [Reichenbachiella versicolor]